MNHTVAVEVHSLGAADEDRQQRGDMGACAAYSNVTGVLVLQIRNLRLRGDGMTTFASCGMLATAAGQ